MGEGGTYHLIDAAAIDKMKESVMLVNTARGGLVAPHRERDGDVVAGDERASRVAEVAAEVHRECRGVFRRVVAEEEFALAEAGGERLLVPDGDDAQNGVEGIVAVGHIASSSWSVFACDDSARPYSAKVGTRQKTMLLLTQRRSRSRS